MVGDAAIGGVGGKAVALGIHAGGGRRRPVGHIRRDGVDRGLTRSLRIGDRAAGAVARQIPAGREGREVRVGLAAPACFPRHAEVDHHRRHDQQGEEYQREEDDDRATVVAAASSARDARGDDSSDEVTGCALTPSTLLWPWRRPSP